MHLVVKNAVPLRTTRTIFRRLSTTKLPWQWPATPSRPAVTSGDHTYSYDDLHRSACAVQGKLGDIRGRRIGVLLPPSFGFVAVIAAVWQGGGGVVPLVRGDWQDIVEDAGCEVVVGSNEIQEGLNKERVTTRRLVVEKDGELGEVETTEETLTDDARRKDEDVAMLLYTSGTTGKPKGVVWTHEMIKYQLQVLSSAWKWSAEDRIVSSLPLNHVHGLVNVLLCTIYNGAHVELMERFDVNALWNRLDSGDISVFMGVPTMYRRLVKRYNEGDVGLRGGVRGLRLSVCGSASLDGETWDQWENISGKRLLERYGMTEVGMALSSGYEMEDRVKNFVGRPLEGVQARVAEEDELRLKGPGVFKRYWRREKETKEAFDNDGWFRTGDVVQLDQEGKYKIVGRLSTDIIKSGGYKISALEVERVVGLHDAVEECAVVGIDDTDLGQQVVGVVVPTNFDGKDCINEKELLKWVGERLPRYKVPRRILLVPALPKSNLGKTQKKVIRQALIGEELAATDG